MTGSLLWRFAMISLLAIGGGTTIPLIEQVSVREQRWIDTEEFATAFAMAQVMPGPVLVMATFIGYRAGGLTGALASTTGAFALPWFLGASAGRARVRRAWPASVGRLIEGATASAVGLSASSAVRLIHQAGPGLAPLLIAAGACLLALKTNIHPALIVLGGVVLGVLWNVTPAAQPAG